LCVYSRHLRQKLINFKIDEPGTDSVNDVTYFKSYVTLSCIKGLTFVLLIFKKSDMKNSKLKFIVYTAVAALLFVTTTTVNAQKAEFGMRFMPTVSNFDMQTSSGGTVNGEVTLGYGVGALLGFNFSDHVGIQGEVIYSSLNQQYKEEDVEYKVNLKYINIPLLFAFNTNKSGPVNLNLVGGPQIGISVGSDVFTSGSNGTSDSQPVVSVKKGDLGLAYGAGVDFGLNPSGNLRLGIGFRGVYGLLDISDNSNTTTTDSYYVLDRTHMKTYSLYTGLSLLF